MADAALLAFLKQRRGLLDGVAFTGGAPLLRAGLPDLLRRVRELGYAVKLDTNGTRPAALRAILEEGLADYVAMDIKNSPDRYAETAGVPSLDLAPVYESIALLRDAAPDYEFRTTVVDELHDEASFPAIGEMIAGAKRYFLQPFADRDTVLFAGFHAPDKARLKAYAELVRPCVAAVEIRGADVS
jgi:pyruvate formate lyase activating enzyme